MQFFLGFLYKVQENNIYLKCNFCNVVNLFTVTFDQFNRSLLSKSINFFSNQLYRP